MLLTSLVFIMSSAAVAGDNCNPATALTVFDEVITWTIVEKAKVELTSPTLDHDESNDISVVNAGLPVFKQEPVIVQNLTFKADASFAFDSVVLTPSARNVLDHVVTQLQHINIEVIIVTGHTDSIGSAEYNTGLSLLRARSVKDYLLSKGVDSLRLYVEARGETEPIASNKTRSGREINRRFELDIVGVKR